MGALFLDVLDRRMEAMGLYYIRCMDDWVILAPTRWSLRKAVRIVNETLDELRVQQHPDKTFIGKTDRGFSFLGYDFNERGSVGIARPTKQQNRDSTSVYALGGNQPHFMSKVRVSLALATTSAVGDLGCEWID